MYLLYPIASGDQWFPNEFSDDEMTDESEEYSDEDSKVESFDENSDDELSVLRPLWTEFISWSKSS